MKYSKLACFLILFILLFTNCKKSNNGEEDGCPMYSIVPHQPYDDPVWHPSGEIIGFNYIPIKEIVYNYGYDCPMQASYTYEDDSAGFYLVNADGTNQRRVLPYYLITPAWSNDGNWIAFSCGGQIHKMAFDGEKFDTTAIEQLTFEGGSNFFPDWSPDNEWIAYSQNICNDTECGVWYVNVNTRSPEFIGLYGSYPNYYTQNLIMYSTSVVKEGHHVGDSIWIYNISDNQKSFIKFIENICSLNRCFKYCSINDKIAFNNGVNILLTDLTPDTEEQHLISEAGNFSWSPDGKFIVYQHRVGNYRIDEAKGTLWIINTETEEKRQLTYNHFNLIIN